MSDATKRVARTLLQVLVAVAVAAPVVIDQLGVPTTVGWAAAVLAVSGIVTRVMQVPEVDALLAKLGVGADAHVGEHEAP